MSITPDDFLSEAKATATRKDEMGIRLTVSRAYYAAYHWALTVSYHCPTPPPKNEGVHKALVRRFSSVPQKGFQGSRIARDIGGWLDKGRRLRTMVDYELSATVDKNAGTNAITYAEHIRDLVAEFAALYTS